MQVKRTVFIRKFGRIIGLFIFLALVSTGFYKAANVLFRIETIEVVGEHVYVEVDKKRLSTNLLFFPAEKMKAQLLSDNPLLRKVAFRKKFPHTLIITVSVPAPVARLQTGGSILLLDTTGLVVGEANPVSFPLLVFDIGNVTVASSVKDDRVVASLSLLAALDSSIKVDVIKSYNSKSLLAKVGQTDIIIAQEASVSSVVTTLQTLFTGFRIKGTLPKVIDLRFDKPVVTF